MFVLSSRSINLSTKKQNESSCLPHPGRRRKRETKMCVQRGRCPLHSICSHIILQFETQNSDRNLSARPQDRWLLFSLKMELDANQMNCPVGALRQGIWRGRFATLFYVRYLSPFSLQGNWL